MQNCASTNSPFNTQRTREPKGSIIREREAPRLQLQPRRHATRCLNFCFKNEPVLFIFLPWDLSWRMVRLSGKDEPNHFPNLEEEVGSSFPRITSSSRYCCQQGLLHMVDSAVERGVRRVKFPQKRLSSPSQPVKWLSGGWYAWRAWIMSKFLLFVSAYVVAAWIPIKRYLQMILLC